MTAIISQVNYIPAENDSYISTGHKRGEYPQGAWFHGGNGTFRVGCGTPADIEVVAYGMGRRLSFRIGGAARSICGWTRLTSNRAERICAARPYEVQIELREGRYQITNDSLMAWLRAA